MQALVFGHAYWRIADKLCCSATLRRRRDEGVDSEVMDALRNLVLEEYNRLTGLQLDDVTSHRRLLHQIPRGGESVGKSPVDRGKRGLKHSTGVDLDGKVAPPLSHPMIRDEQSREHSS